MCVRCAYYEPEKFFSLDFDFVSYVALRRKKSISTSAHRLSAMMRRKTTKQKKMTFPLLEVGSWKLELLMKYILVPLDFLHVFNVKSVRVMSTVNTSHHHNVYSTYYIIEEKQTYTFLHQYTQHKVLFLGCGEVSAFCFECVR